jgi:hypothetical protein
MEKIMCFSCASSSFHHLFRENQNCSERPFTIFINLLDLLIQSPFIVFIALLDLLGML